MDTPIMIIGLVLTLVVAIPIYFVLRAQKVNKGQITTLFAQHNQNNKYQFQLVANQGRKVLGMDSKNKGLLFIDLNLKEPFVSFHDLKQSESCEVATSSPQGRANVLKKIEWIFMSKNGKTTDNSITFHDSDKNYIVPVYAYEELKLAQEWQQTIQQHLQ